MAAFATKSSPGVAQRTGRIDSLRTIEYLDTRPAYLSSVLRRPTADLARGSCINFQRLSSDPFDTQMLNLELTLFSPLLKSFRILKERAQNFRQPGGMMGGDENARLSVLQQLGDSIDIRCDNRAASLACL